MPIHPDGNEMIALGQPPGIDDLSEFTVFAQSDRGSTLDRQMTMRCSSLPCGSGPGRSVCRETRAAPALMGVTDPGPRDHLITRRMRRVLASLDPMLRGDEPLDPAEAPTRLARHAMEELRRQLSSIYAADDQAALVNDLLARAASDDLDDVELALPARVLLGIRRRSPSRGTLPGSSSASS